MPWSPRAAFSCGQGRGPSPGHHAGLRPRPHRRVCAPLAIACPKTFAQLREGSGWAPSSGLQNRESSPCSSCPGSPSLLSGPYQWAQGLELERNREDTPPRSQSCHSGELGRQEFGLGEGTFAPPSFRARAPNPRRGAGALGETGERGWRKGREHKARAGAETWGGGVLRALGARR